MTLQEMKIAQTNALNRAELLLDTAEQAQRGFTEAEKTEYDDAMREVRSMGDTIKARETRSTIRSMFNKDGVPTFLFGGDQPAGSPAKPGQRQLSRDYREAFFDYVGSGGKRIEAALYEGSDGAGGYAVPITVDSNIVQLAPPEMAVRKLAMLIPTAMDIKIPRKGSFGVAGAKAESGAATNYFPETDPTLEQFTLSAFTAGIQEKISFELAQDVPNFTNFCVNDMLFAQGIYEEDKYINGSGTGEAQGLIGNTGAGVTGVAAGTDTYASELLDATFDVMGKLNAVYHPGAAWLMSRATSILLRKAQKQANLFEPVFVRSGGVDYLHGYPVEYSASMPVVGTGNTPVLFGDFKQGYIIGDRGGAGINVRILDQPLATAGQIVLLAYRRSDGRIRRSEAIQAITCVTFNRRRGGLNWPVWWGSAHGPAPRMLLFRVPGLPEAA